MDFKISSSKIYQFCQSGKNNALQGFFLVGTSEPFFESGLARAGTEGRRWRFVHRLPLYIYISLYCLYLKRNEFADGGNVIIMFILLLLRNLMRMRKVIIIIIL